MAQKDEDIVREAHKRFARCEDREAENRELFIADLKFANADPDNGYQWDEDMLKKRTLDKRPALTINKVKQHNRQITNDARQNKPSIKVQPIDNGADKRTADVFNGIIRHIEAASTAETAYDTAAEFAVDAGLGYWRITTDYASDDSFDQEIFIKRVKNPLNVYLDPDIQEADGSDARFGFVFEVLSKEEFERKFPNAEMDSNDWGEVSGGWQTKDTVRVCEYFNVVDKSDTLIAGPDGQSFLLSSISDPAEREAIKADPEIQSRPVQKRTVKWHMIAGEKVIETKEWLGKYVPIVRVVGSEVEIEGETIRSSHTRGMKDAQRSYNYWNSSAVEFVALQGKQPYIAPAQAIAGYQDYWDNLNTSSDPYLPYNAVDDDGNAIAAPRRQEPPMMSQAYIQGMQISSDDMQAASGQYDAQLGENANQQSGRALNALQRKGDNATFHFIDNVARAIKYTGMILIDLIPKIYDTERVVRILGEDGKEDKAHIDPEQQGAVEERYDDMTGGIQEIYNPSVGRYDVTVTVGPSYGTKRQEAFQALSEIAAQNPAIMQIAGDLIMQAADFPMADKLAERLEKALPPELKDTDDQSPQDPQVQQMQQQLEQMSQQMEQMAKALEDKEHEQAIKEYEAETNRLKVVSTQMTPEQINLMIMQTLHDITSEESIGEEEKKQEPNEPNEQPEQPEQEEMQ
jgi:hypothetical protein